MTCPRGTRYAAWPPPKPVHGRRRQSSHGLRIGLLGGSFNPAHDGHLAISVEALNRLALHQVWWLVAPQNPLKNPQESAPYTTRLAGAETVATDPRIVVSGLEHRWRCRYTIETVRMLKDRFPAHRFVWLMGADNFATLHLWEDWTGIVERMPIAVLNRPQYLLAATNSKAARRYARARVPANAAAALPCNPAPAWSLLDFPLNPQSSTALRLKANGDGAKDAQ